MMLTQANRISLPALYSTDGQGMDAIAQVRYFWGGRSSMLVTEFDGEDTLFGYITNEYGEGEWGYASLSEMQATQGRMGGVERDYYYTPARVGDGLASLIN